MKIDNSAKSIIGGQSLEDTGRLPKRRPDDNTAAAQSAHVQLSPLSAQLQSIQRGMADTPAVNSARVAELKEAISSGHFKVDADKVADRLLQTVQELIAAHRTS